jgi:hypothetical protein
MMCWRWLAVGIVLSHALPAYSKDKKQPPSAKEIKALIDKLVSPNPEPIIRGSGHRLPPGFDLKKQEQVHRALRKLKQLGPRAFPFLIECWGDKRYCLTGCEAGSFNVTVGEICRTIISDQLQPYDDCPAGYSGRPPNRRPNYQATILGSRESARQWWKKNQHKTLYQMQRAVLDWVIAEEAKRPRDFKDAERRQLQQIRKKLVKSRKPLPPGSSIFPDYEGGGK